MIRVCRKEGNNNPDLWVQVLGYLVNNALSGDPQQASPDDNEGDDGNPGSRSSSGKEDDGGATSDEEGGGGVGGEGRWDDVQELLALIERDQVLSPLRVSSACASERASKRERVRGSAAAVTAAGGGASVVYVCVMLPLLCTWFCWCFFFCVSTHRQERRLRSNHSFINSFNGRK